MGIGSHIASAIGKRKLKKVAKKPLQAAKKPFQSGLSKITSALKKEASVGPVLHQQVLGALRQMQAKDPNLTQTLKKAHGYAVFPDIGKANVVLGGAFGMGEVFEHGRVIGYTGLVQVTIGLQVGGHTYRELVVFDTPEALKAFKQSKVGFSANASAVIVTAGAAKSNGKPGMRVFVQSEGGMMIEAGLGGQKFIYKPAVLGRLETAKETQKQAIATQASRVRAHLAH